MDNASYHNTTEESAFPNSNSSKDTIRKWLDDNEIPWSQDMLKTELYALCKERKPNPTYKIDKIAEASGHSVLRTPQYHPELQPIETCWGVVKNDMARHCDFTLTQFRKNLPRAFSKVTSKTCQSLVDKIMLEEDKYWNEDESIDKNQSIDTV